MSMEDKQLKALLIKGETFIVDLRRVPEFKSSQKLVAVLRNPKKTECLVWETENGMAVYVRGMFVFFGFGK